MRRSLFGEAVFGTTLFGGSSTDPHLPVAATVRHAPNAPAETTVGATVDFYLDALVLDATPGDDDSALVSWAMSANGVSVAADVATHLVSTTWQTRQVMPATPGVVTIAWTVAYGATVADFVDAVRVTA